MSRGILVVGSLNMDMSVHMETMPAVGETVLGDGLGYQMGGKGANQACACGWLGGDVKILGCVGRMSSGADRSKALERRGGMPWDCGRAPGRPPVRRSFTWTETGTTASW